MIKNEQQLKMSIVVMRGLEPRVLSDTSVLPITPHDQHRYLGAPRLRLWISTASCF